jgi:hypothetical protein
MIRRKLLNDINAQLAECPNGVRTRRLSPISGFMVAQLAELAQSFLSSSFGWTCCCCWAGGRGAAGVVIGPAHTLALSSSCASANRNQCLDISTRAFRASSVEAERDRTRHSCARCRYSVALVDVTVAPLVHRGLSTRETPAAPLASARVCSRVAARPRATMYAPPRAAS